VLPARPTGMLQPSAGEVLPARRLSL